MANLSGDAMGLGLVQCGNGMVIPCACGLHHIDSLLAIIMVTPKIKSKFSYLPTISLNRIHKILIYSLLNSCNPVSVSVLTSEVLYVASIGGTGASRKAIESGKDT